MLFISFMGLLDSFKTGYAEAFRHAHGPRQGFLHAGQFICGPAVRAIGMYIVGVDHAQ